MGEKLDEDLEGAGQAAGDGLGELRGILKVRPVKMPSLLLLLLLMT
jgi:hypothetical protein